MLVNTQGIVLRQFPFSDTSIIVKVFTKDFGLVSFIVKGAKSPKNNKGNICKPANMLDISFYNRENKSLKQLKDIQLKFAPDAKIFGIYKSAITMFIAEFLYNTIPAEVNHPEPEKYDFIHYSMDFLVKNPLNTHFYLAFMYQYSFHLGIDIPLNNSNMGDFLSDYLSLEKLHLNRQERKQLFLQFENHYLENLTNYKPLKSIDIINQILQ